MLLSGVLPAGVVVGGGVLHPTPVTHHITRPGHVRDSSLGLPAVVPPIWEGPIVVSSSKALKSGTCIVLLHLYSTAALPDLVVI